MNTRISDDPFSSISLPPVSMVRQILDTQGEQAVSIQVSQTDVPNAYPTASTKRPMSPVKDSVTVDQIASEVQIGGGAVEVVGSDGKLNKVVKHTSWVTPTSYPTQLQTTTSGKTVILDSNGFEVSNGTQNVRIFFSDFSKNMSIKEIDVCVSGVDKKMLILASDPY